MTFAAFQETSSRPRVRGVRDRLMDSVVALLTQPLPGEQEPLSSDELLLFVAAFHLAAVKEGVLDPAQLEVRQQQLMGALVAQLGFDPHSADPGPFWSNLKAFFVAQPRIGRRLAQLSEIFNDFVTSGGVSFDQQVKLAQLLSASARAALVGVAPPRPKVTLNANPLARQRKRFHR